MTSRRRQPDPTRALPLALILSRLVEITPPPAARELAITRLATRRAAHELRQPR